MSTKSRSLIMYRNKNTVPPDSFLKRAIAAYPHWCGLAFSKGGDLLTDVSHEPATMEGLKKFFTAYADVDVIFIFGKEENGKRLPEQHANLQPFNIVVAGEGDDATPKVIAFIDGDLSGYAKNTDAAGRPYLFCKQYLTPKLRDMWETLEDEDKFSAWLRKPHVEQEVLASGLDGDDKELTVAILTCAEEKGFISFMASDKKSGEYPWGFVSDNLGWTEDDGGGGGKDDEEHTEGGDGNAAGTKSNGTADTTATTAWLGHPPRNIVKNEQLRAQYLEYHGKADPKDYKKYAWHTVLPGMEAAARKAGWELKPLASVAAVEPVRQPAQQQPSGNTGNGNRTSVPGVNAKEQATKFVKAIDASTLEVMTPEQMEKNEKERPTFFDQTGAKPEDVIRWGMDRNKQLIRTLVASGEDGYKMLATLITDLGYMVHRLNSEMDALTAPKEEPKPEPKATRPRVSISR